jgi:AcrR family transcriptional regulator
MDMDKPGIDPVLARQRLLDAADELFYRQGMHRVSIDRVIEKAGVPAETLREAFGSTDELVRAYLRACHTRLQDALARELPRYRTPRERLVGAFEIQGQSFVEPGFRGCALVTASAEALPGEVVEEVVTEYRDWIHNLFFDLAFAAEVTHPEELAEQLVVLFDGAAISAWLDAKPSTVNTTRAVAQALIGAHGLCRRNPRHRLRRPQRGSPRDPRPPRRHLPLRLGRLRALLTLGEAREHDARP